MANKLGNRIKMTVMSAAGTADVQVNTAVPGFLTFSAAGITNGDTVPYVIEDGQNWEIGYGVYVAATTTLVRTTVVQSSSGGPKISLTAGAVVMLSPLASDLQSGEAANQLVRLDGAGKLPGVDGSALTGLNASHIGSGTVPAANLPNPAATTLGGVKSKAAEATKFLTAIGLDGSVSNARPAASDITGLAASATTDTTNAANITSGILNNARLLGVLLAANNLSDVTPALARTNLGLGAVAIENVIPITKGGTGLTSLTAGYIPFGAGTGAFGNDSGLFWDNTNKRLGVGTTSPTRTLDVNGSVGAATVRLISVANPYLSLNDGTTTSYVQVADSALNLSVGGANPITFTINNSERMRIDASGNLGLGVTPSAWGGGKAFEVGGSGSGLWWYGSTSLYNTMNCRFDGTSWRYGATGQASLYLQSAGQHIWNTAASGSAGSAISFSQAMTLDANGLLGLGQTSMSYRLDMLGGGGSNTLRLVKTAGGSGGAHINAMGTAEASFAGGAAYNAYSGWYRFNPASTSASGVVFASGATTFWGNTGLTAGTVFTATQLMTLDASGNLGIGGSAAANSRLDVIGSSSRIRWNMNNAYVYQAATNAAGSAFADIYYDGANHQWQSSSVTKMTLAASGNLGIGTTSPSQKLHIAGGSIRVDATDSSALGEINFGFTGGTPGLKITGLRVLSNNDQHLLFYTSSTATSGVATERMRIDASGNLGLGVTPSAWSGKAIQIAGPAYIASTSQVIEVAANGAWDGSNWKYTSSSYAGRYTQVFGTHQWHTAASGTAGGTISFTQAMTLDASGNLGIGNTSPSCKFHVVSSDTLGIFENVSSNVNTYIRVGSATASLTLGVDTDNNAYHFTANSLKLFAGSSERVRIDSAGVVTIKNGTAPSTNPSGGGYLYVESGALKYRGSSGTVTTIAAA